MRLFAIALAAVAIAAISLVASPDSAAAGTLREDISRPQTPIPDMSIVDSRKPLVYVSDATNDLIDIFDIDGKHIGELTTGLNAPAGLFVDKRHRLWVANSGASNVLVYARGSTRPDTILTQPSQYQPSDVALCPDGTAFVASSGAIAVYPPGKTAPARYLEAELSMTGGLESNVTCDAKGNVFANGLIGLSPVFATTGWTGGKQSGYYVLSYFNEGGIKATPAGTLLTGGFIDSEPAVIEITESGSPTGRSILTGDFWPDIAITPQADVVFGADPTAREGLARTFPGGSPVDAYASGNLANLLTGRDYVPLVAAGTGAGKAGAALAVAAGAALAVAAGGGAGVAALVTYTARHVPVSE